MVSDARKSSRPNAIRKPISSAIRRLTLTKDEKELITVMPHLHAFFDESEREDTGYLVVGGCLFEERQLKKFRRQWDRLFGQFGGCHMKDLFAGKEAFAGLPIRERERLEIAGAGIIRDRVERMVVTTIRPDEFASPTDLPVESYYTTCCLFCIAQLDLWMTMQQRAEGIAYVFEDGYTKPGQRANAKAYFREMPEDVAREMRCAVPVAFLPKADSMWLQSADMVAWLGGRHMLQRLREAKGGYLYPNVPTPMRPSLAMFESAGKIELKCLRISELKRCIRASDERDRQLIERGIV